MSVSISFVGKWWDEIYTSAHRTLNGCDLVLCPNCNQLIDETCNPNHKCKPSMLSGVTHSYPAQAPKDCSHLFTRPIWTQDFTADDRCVRCGIRYEDAMNPKPKPDFAQLYARMDKK